MTVDDKGVCLMVGKEGEEPKELRAEQMLVAAGRALNTDNVGLETTRAKVEKGFVKVDARMRTAEPHLYAIGDIIGGLLLAHVAAHEGITAVSSIVGAETEGVDYLKMPRATYSRPQIASIGRTQAECEKEGIPIKVGKVPFQAIGKALIGGDYEGFTKVIAHKETDQILGVHMIGPHVTDLIAEASAAMLFEATAWEIGETVHPHPDPVRGARRSRAGRGRALDQLLGAQRRRRGWRPKRPSGPTRQPRTGGLGEDLGLTRDDLLEMYRLVALARAIDERMWILNRAGKIPFVISGQGHEGAQVGIAYGLQKGLDWLVPYYRSVASLITFGMTPREIMLAQFAKASRPELRRPPDARPLRRRRPQHPLGLLAGGHAAAARHRHRLGGQGAQDRPGGDHPHRRGLQQPGRRARGHELRRHPRPAGDLRDREQRLRHQRADRLESAVEDIAVRGAGYGMPGVILDGVDVLDCYRLAKAAIDRARGGRGRRSWRPRSRA